MTVAIPRIRAADITAEIHCVSRLEKQHERHGIARNLKYHLRHRPDPVLEQPEFVAARRAFGIPIE